MIQFNDTWIKWGYIRINEEIYPDSKVLEANMEPTWVLSAPDGPHVGPMNLAIRVKFSRKIKGDELNNHLQVNVNVESVIVSNRTKPKGQ